MPLVTGSDDGAEEGEQDEEDEAVPSDKDKAKQRKGKPKQKQGRQWLPFGCHTCLAAVVVTIWMAYLSASHNSCHGQVIAVCRSL